jgi:branched-chain amino acid transport system substrate-binding protein
LRKPTRKQLLAILACGATLALSACSVSSGSSPSSAGSTASSAASAGPIVFGAAVPLSGVVAVSGRQLESALDASATYINNHGGIKGRKLEWKFEDDGFPSGSQAATAVRALVADNVVGILNFGTPGVSATYKYLVQQGVPDLILFSGLTAFEPLDPTAASVYTDYKTQGEALGEYAAQKYPGEKVSVLYENDDLGQSYLNGFKAKDPHIAVAEPYASTDVDFTSQLNAMKASNAPLAACFCLSPEIAQMLKFRQSNSWNPPVITESSNAGAGLVSAVGASLTQNVISNDFFPPTSGSGSTSAITSLVSSMTSIDSSVPLTSFTVVAAALNQLIEKVADNSSAPLTRQSFATALHSTQVTGAWYGKTSTEPSADDRSIFSCWRPTVIQSGVSVPTGSVTCESDLSG